MIKKFKIIKIYYRNLFFDYFAKFDSSLFNIIINMIRTPLIFLFFKQSNFEFLTIYNLRLEIELLLLILWFKFSESTKKLCIKW